jgi:hypothetical protein
MILRNGKFSGKILRKIFHLTSLDSWGTPHCTHNTKNYAVGPRRLALRNFAHTNFYKQAHTLPLGSSSEHKPAHPELSEQLNAPRSLKPRQKKVFVLPLLFTGRISDFFFILQHSLCKNLFPLLICCSERCNGYRACHWTQGPWVRTRPRAMEFEGDIHRTTSFGVEDKPSAPCRKILRHVK